MRMHVNVWCLLSAADVMMPGDWVVVGEWVSERSCMAVLLYAVHWMSWTGSLSSVSDKHSLKTPTPLRGLPISAQGTHFLKKQLIAIL
jgi:hypothetical protein